MQVKMMPTNFTILICHFLAFSTIDFTSGFQMRFKNIFNLQQENNDVHAMLNGPRDESSPQGLTFAELGVSYTPKIRPGFTEVDAYSFLHASDQSVGVDHDIVNIKKVAFNLTGKVKGLVAGNPLTVIVGTTYGSRFDVLLEKKVSVEDDGFLFKMPRGRFFLKIEGSGYNLPGVRKVQFPCRVRFCPFINGSGGSVLVVEQVIGNQDVYKYSWKLQNISQYGIESLNIVGSDEASMINANNPGIVDRVDASDAAAKLRTFYGIELHGVWGNEYASRILGVVHHMEWLKTRHPVDNLRQKWILTNEVLHPMDVKIVRIASTEQNNENGGINLHDLPENSQYHQVVYFSREAFMYSVKRALEKKQNGFYFSRRLFKAAIRALCLHDPERMKMLFKHTHNVEILEPYELESAEANGKRIVPYPHNEYQSWFKHPEELIEMATSWTEYPTGMHKILGLKYLVRRLDGTVNKESPTAPAIAYPRGPDVDSYIEFMESGFYQYFDVPQLILHELGHFIHINMTSETLRDDWIALGKWKQDPVTPDKWITSLQTEFVNAYAHEKGPNEDFASSLADYVLNPNLLRSRAKAKYLFIKTRVMSGSYYVTRASHEFTVYNLGNRDYNYPGRITMIDVTVTGSLNEDKTVVIGMVISKRAKNSCANNAKFRLYSESNTTHDVTLYGEGCSHEFKGTFGMSKSVKRGIWTTDQIMLTDSNNLKRYVGIDDFGMRVWLNNGLEDFQEPRAILPSVALSLVSVDGFNAVRTSWLAVDDGIVSSARGGFATLTGSAIGQHALTAYSEDKYGTDDDPSLKWRSEAWSGVRKIPSRLCEVDFVRRESKLLASANNFVHEDKDWFTGLSYDDAQANVFNCFRIAVNIPISSAARTGNYYLTRLVTEDSGGNRQSIQWPESKGPHVLFQSLAAHPDNTKPLVRNIGVSSQPVNKARPNGETLVDISFDIRDEDSGIASLRCKIVDPFGGIVFVYPDRARGTEWQRIFHRHVLPRGSLPGVWHLAGIRAEDWAGNELDARLSENILVSGNI
ncbi:hypothetical protein BdWA1_000854 [Babesia duncani]|uniref:Uncharacterized protein n=1 Tax=Babesia duncani TaxID=323732 RepID=A0AAD9PN17_9APIC|nr:hypothetical protein BdWA1_000854 [Babesia duncani]